LINPRMRCIPFSHSIPGTPYFFLDGRTLSGYDFCHGTNGASGGSWHTPSREPTGRSARHIGAIPKGSTLGTDGRGIMASLELVSCVFNQYFLSGQRSVDRLLPKSLFALSKTFFDKSKAPSRRCQNSPLGLKQLTSLIFHFAKICLQKTF